MCSFTVIVLKPGFGIPLRTGTVRGQNFIRLLLPSKSLNIDISCQKNEQTTFIKNITVLLPSSYEVWSKPSAAAAALPIQLLLKLKETIKQNTGFAISFEGIYKWVAFVHSKSSSSSSSISRCRID